MANVIRQDIIEIGFKTDLGTLNKINDGMDKLKKSVSNDVDDGLGKLKKSADDAKKSVSGLGKSDGVDKLKKEVNKTADDMDELGDSTKKTKKFLDRFKNTDTSKLNSGLNKVKNNLSAIAKKASGAAYRGLKKVAGISFKAIVGGMGAAATAIGGLVAKSVSAYANYEQQIGGVETLLGAKGAKSVKEYAKLTGKSVGKVKGEYKKLTESQNLVVKNANDAYKTAGLSANDYMETVTSFSASLLQSTGNDTMKAAKLANTAVSDMSDNANKMGTDMGSIQWAYQGFAKQNYTMLDNLKLGYGGTKSEMQRLVKDAAKLDKSVKANSLSYGNIVKAIHAVQKETGIYGTTQKEAEHTISGSLNSLKAAWGNLMPALIQGGDSFNQCVDNLVDSAAIFAKNIKPAIIKALSGIGKLIEKVSPIIEKEFPKLVDELLPPLLKAATSLVKGLIVALPNIIKVIVKELPNIAKQLGAAITEAFGFKLPVFDKLADFFTKNGEKIKKSIPYLLGLVAVVKVLKTLSSFKGIFGGSKGGNKSLLSGLTDTFKQLAKTKTSTILKGMANLGIIIAGFTGMAALLMLVAPQIAKLSSTGAIVKLIAVIGALGLVGSELAKWTGSVGKIPIKTVLKGLANIALVIAGMSALYLLIGAVSLVNFNLAQVLKVAAIIGALGTLGAVLAGFAGLVGLIPIPIVLKGLANIGLVIGGLSALYLLIGAVSLINFDTAQILKITAIMGALGGVGSVMAVFAGIIGMIPIPVVLAGLANIALVIGGMTALIAAFGALSKIEGFDEFMTSGGKTLANLFRVIGQIGGSLVGGLGEGISNSLPAIGKNIATFAKSIKPMFTMLQGVDMSGVGSFLNSFANFMLKMTGNNLLSKIGGKTDLGSIGTQLTTFAAKASGFFVMVAKLPAAGFTNAKLLFSCLSGISNVPKTGGLVQWFGGETDFSSLASGLSKLSGKGVIGFFTNVAKIPQAGFANAKSLFKSLSGIGGLPKTGGIKQWFTGETNISGIAKQLPSFGKAVASFYTSISKIDDMSKIPALFKALKDIKDLPKKGGLKQKFSGTNDLASIGSDLKTFGENIQGFIAQVNKINLGNLNGLWQSLKQPSTITTNSLQIVTKNIDSMVSKAKQLPNKMGDAIRSTGNSLANAITAIWNRAASASSAGANKVVSSANFVLSQIGSKSKLASVKGYANGTNGHKGGNALVNDGNGAELVQMPNGQSFIPKGRNVLIPNAPKGMKVLPANGTAQLMGRKSPTYRYADGTGDFDVWNYIDNPKGLTEYIRKSATSSGSDFNASVRNGVVNTITGKMASWFKKKFDEMGALSLANYDASKGVAQWRTTVIRALKMEGQYSAANVKRTLYQMQTESGGNPRAINNWDSNAKKGTPSKGLMQVIDPTFRAYARAGFNKNIYDPLSNILASIRYAVSRYGSLGRAYQGHGYSNGGLVTKAGWIGEQNKPEMVIPLSQNKRKRGVNLWQQTGDMLGVRTPVYSPESNVAPQSTSRTENNTYAPVFNLTVSGTSDDRATARKVKKWVKEAMDEVFEGMATKNPKVREV